MRQLILGALLLFTSCCTYAKSGVVELDPKSTVRIQGVVTSQILLKGRELLDMASTNKEVTLLINSPGGSVMAGLMFIDTMELVKSRGTSIRCVVPNLAASMAFQILAHCDTRLALPSAILLWHPAKLGCFMCAMSAEEMLYQGSMLNLVEQPQNEYLIKAMNVDPDFFYYHYAHETAWTTYALIAKVPGFIEQVVDIRGIVDFQAMDGESQGYYDNLVERLPSDF